MEKKQPPTIAPEVVPLDLAALDFTNISEAGAEIEILHPTTNAPTGIRIRVVGADSDLFQRTSDRIANRRASSIRIGQIKPLTAEEHRENGLELLASCTLGWTGVMFNGEVIPFTKQAAKDLYRKFNFIKEQIDAFMGDRSNFLPH